MAESKWTDTGWISPGKHPRYYFSQTIMSRFSQYLFKIKENSKISTFVKRKYHLVREVIRNPRNTVSSRIGAKTPVMPNKQAVLPQPHKNLSEMSVISLSSSITLFHIIRKAKKEIPDTRWANQWQQANKGVCLKQSHNNKTLITYK